MRALTNNTLVAISRHTNKVLKVANYMAQSEQPLLLDNIFMIDDTTTQKDALEFFQKDFDKTVDIIEKSHQLLSTVRFDHVVEQLDNNEKDISKIFGDKYDTSRYSISLPSIEVHLKVGLEKESVRDSLTKHLLDIPYKEFRDFIKNCDKIYKLDEYSIETEEDAIEYLASLAYREKYDIIIQKIKTIAGDFSEYRSQLGLQTRNLIDNEITFSRSMIDSVMKNSTYITKDSIEQIASPHKKDMQSLKALYDIIKDNKYINAIELDPDTNLKGVIDILNKTSDLKLNLAEQFCLKCRKLGNYGANGMYLPRLHIAAVDITNPSALIHELTHTVDMSNGVLYNHKLRDEIVNKFRKRIDLSDLTVLHKKNYYLNPDEIIARLGEISYILNKNEYNGQPMVEFIEKVKGNEKVYNSEFLNIAKPISDYLKYTNIYFNFENLNSSDLFEIKDYFQSYFGVNHDEIQPIYSKPIFHEEKQRVTARKRTNEFKDSPFVKLDTTSITKALNYNLQNNLIPFENFFSRVAENIHMIARRKKTLVPSEIQDQMDTSTLIYDWAMNQNKDIQVALMKNMAQFVGTPQAYAFMPLKIAMHLSENDEHREVLLSFYNSLQNSQYLNSNGMSAFRTNHQKGIKKLLTVLNFEDIYSRLDKHDVYTHTLLHNEHHNKFLLAAGINLKEHMGQMINSSIKNGYYDSIEKTIIQVNTNKTHENVLRYTEEQVEFMVKNEMTYGLQLTGEFKHTFSFLSSINQARVNMASLGLKVEDLKEAFNDIAILGDNKVKPENFKEIRRKVMDEYLAELQKKQAEDASIKPVDTKIIEKLQEKIRVEETKVEKLEAEPTPIVEKPKPITVDRTSQIKLF